MRKISFCTTYAFSTVATVMVFALSDVNTIHTAKHVGERYGWTLPLGVLVIAVIPTVFAYIGGRIDATKD